MEKLTAAKSLMQKKVRDFGVIFDIVQRIAIKMLYG